jgi:hypothetical protein
MKKLTLRDFLKNNNIPEDDKLYFNYSATLRIRGDIGNLDDITRLLGIQPTRTHKKGERKGPRSPEYKDDFWCFSPNIDEEKELSDHIDGLWDAIKNKKDVLLKLKEELKIDVFLGYRSNCDTAGIEIPYRCLELFNELKIPFGISIIIT